LATLNLYPLTSTSATGGPLCSTISLLQHGHPFKLTAANCW
jgi:hypothetical protein